jgi:hypothetical protein
MTQDFSTVNGSDTLDDGRLAYNAALEALRSAFSGATEPSAAEAGQLWLDTTTDALKMRNSSDDGWVQIADGSNGVCRTAAFAVDMTSASPPTTSPCFYAAEALTIESIVLVCSANTSGSNNTKYHSVQVANKGASGSSTTLVAEADTDTDGDFVSWDSWPLNMQSGAEDMAADEVLQLAFTTTGSPTDLGSARISIFIHYHQA